MKHFLCLIALALNSVSHAADTVTLSMVETSVSRYYPPFLIALIEQDIASGRLKIAQGAFDLGFVTRGTAAPGSYYDGQSADFVFDQALPFWGGNVFAGYRVSSGALADYDKSRTQTQGELRAGIRLNLLRDGVIDRRRAELWKARLDVEIAEPFIRRQQLDLQRNAMRSYGNWVALGLRLGVTEELERIAENRDAAIAQLVEKGQVAPIVKTDNERLVVSRTLAVVQSRRRFEGAGIELSLFLRNNNDGPVLAKRDQLPGGFPKLNAPAPDALPTAVKQAFAKRPELRRIELVAQKLGIDQQLAKNQLLPNLDLTASVSQAFGDKPYKDREDTEGSVALEFRLPLQRRDAKGRVQVAQSELDRLTLDQQFARERIVAEIQDALSAVKAAQQQMEQTQRNVDLAKQLEEAERKRFEQGAADLLALQIREQATFDARLLEIDARAEFYRALTDYEIALAAR
jgi:outer membrane protein TolC